MEVFFEVEEYRLEDVDGRERRVVITVMVVRRCLYGVAEEGNEVKGRSAKQCLSKFPLFGQTRTLYKQHHNHTPHPRGPL